MVIAKNLIDESLLFYGTAKYTNETLFTNSQSATLLTSREDLSLNTKRNLHLIDKKVILEDNWAILAKIFYLCLTAIKFLADLVIFLLRLGNFDKCCLLKQ